MQCRLVMMSCLFILFNDYDSGNERGLGKEVLADLKSNIVMLQLFHHRSAEMQRSSQRRSGFSAG